MQLHLEDLNNSALHFLEHGGLKQTYTTIAKQGMYLLEGEYASIFLKEKGNFKRVYTTDPALYTIKPRKTGFTHRALNSKRPLAFTSSLIKFTKMVHPQLKALHIQSDIFIPLIYRGKSIGVISVMSTRKIVLHENDFLILTLFGQIATLAIIKTQHYTETKTALRTRDLFISMAAHEFRTPITTVFGYAQLIQQKVHDNKAVDPKWTDAVVSEALRLIKLINELLQIDKMKKGELTYAWKNCDLKEIMARAVNDFKNSYPDRKIEMGDDTRTPYMWIRGDFDKLLQIFHNILSNAAKYSEPETVITVSLKQMGHTYSIAITDQGVGIPEAELSKILKKFYRGNTHSHEGMGLGLYLAKRIVEKHGGEITIKSKVKQGTTVSVLLPQVEKNRKTLSS